MSFFGEVWLEVARYATEAVFCDLGRANVVGFWSICDEFRKFVVPSILVEVLLAIAPQLWVRSPVCTFVRNGHRLVDLGS